MYKTGFIFVLFALLLACTATPERESTGEFIDSSLITAKIKAKLADDPLVSVFDIKVDTFKGVVHLSGWVNSKEERVRAGQLAWSIEGVKNVKNGIDVKDE